MGTYKIKIVADDSAGASSAETEFDIVIVHQTISGDETGSVTEGGAPGDDNTGELTAPGSTITLTPKEGTDSPGMSTGTYGVMAFDGTTWTYTLDDRAEALGDQQTAIESFTFSTGGEAFVVTITVTGVNDAPMVGTAITNKTGTINQPIAEINLSDAFTDVDENDTLTLALTVTFDGTDDNTDNGIEVDLTPNGSTITLGDTGLTYNTETNILSGNPRAAGTYTIKIVATDSAGESSAETEFDIVIAPQTISGDDTGSVTEGGALGDDNTGELTAPGSTITLTPKEGTDSPGMSTGTYGVMAFDGTTWTYTLDDRAEALGDQQTAIESFTFSTGGEAFVVTITVTGVNDAPVVGTAITNKTGTINQPIAEINLGDAFTDVDENDTLTLALTVTFDGTDDNTDNGIEVDLTPNGSMITLGDTGLTYNTETHILSGSPSAVGTYKIKIVATDSAGESSAETEFDIVIASQTISGDETGSVTEGGAPGDDNTGELTAPGSTITLTPKEATDSPGMSTGTYGVMTFDGTTWTYTLGDGAEVLADGQTATESFTFSTERGTFVVTITITGANDDPMVSGEFFTSNGGRGEQFTLPNLSDRFTDVDEGDELTFTVTLDDDRPLSTIGLTYNSDDDEITGTLTETGTYVIKIVATDKSGATVEATFDLIIAARPIIERNSLTYNPDATSITIDETMLEVTSGNESDPALLIYTITTLPDAGVLSKSGTPLNNGDTFTQADINNGLITYVPDVSDPSASQSNPLSFTFSDGVVDLEEQTLQITSREVFEDETPAEDNTIDQSSETTPLKIEAGDGNDTITGGTSDDQIDGGAGDDEIILTRTVGGVEEDAGADEVLYTFGYDGVGIDGGDEIVGFKRGQDKLTFVVERNFNSLTEFLQSLNGADETDLTADDVFIVTMQWGTDEAGAFYFDSVLLHFKDASAFSGGRVSSPLVTVTFDERLDFDDLVEILGGEDKVAENFDGGLTAFKNLAEVLPRLFGEGSIGFKGVDPSGTNGASERASEEPQPPIYETLSEQHSDDLQPTSFELGGGETDII